MFQNVVSVILAHLCLQVHPNIMNDSTNQTCPSSHLRSLHPSSEVGFLDLCTLHFLLSLFGLFWVSMVTWFMITFFFKIDLLKVMTCIFCLVQFFFIGIDSCSVEKCLMSHAARCIGH